MKNNKSQSGGFIKIILLIIVVLFLLKYFGKFDVFSFFQSPNSKTALDYTFDVIKVSWDFTLKYILIAWDAIWGWISYILSLSK